MTLVRAASSLFIFSLALLGPAGPALGAPITKQLMLRPIGLCDDNGANCAGIALDVPAMDKIWAQAGIGFDILPALDWNSSTYNAINADQSEELEMFAAGSMLFGDPAVTGIVNLYFVSAVTFTGGTLFGEGCGGAQFVMACQGNTGVMINAPEVEAFGGVGRIDTVAHEIGHVMNLGHTDNGAGGPDNLMTVGAWRDVPTGLGDIAPDGQGLDSLTPQQIEVARSSPYARDVPEPASLTLLAFALGGTALARRIGGIPAGRRLE